MPYYSIRISGWADRVEASTPEEAIAAVKRIADVYSSFSVERTEEPTCEVCFDSKRIWNCAVEIPGKLIPCPHCTSGGL